MTAKLKQGDTINFALAVLYHVNEMGENGLSLVLKKELTPSDTDYDHEPQEIDLDEGEVTFGRNTDCDLVVTHGRVSGTHAYIGQGTIKDNSSFGTFLHVRTLEEVLKGAQSRFVEFDKNL
jgi:hypothetical protein